MLLSPVELQGFVHVGKAEPSVAAACVVVPPSLPRVRAPLLSGVLVLPLASLPRNHEDIPKS